MKLIFTFDDNNSSNKTAAKILNKLGMKGIFLLNDGPDLEEQVKFLLENNQIIGSHTASHKRMSLLSDEEFEKEVVDFHKKLERLAGDVCWFSYPWSDRPVKEEHRKKLRELYPNILRGYNGDKWNVENETNDILRIPIKPYSLEQIKEKIKQEEVVYLQMHGVTGDKEWDVQFDYFFSLLNFYFLINNITIEKEGSIHKILSIFNLRRAKKILDGLQIPFCLFLGTSLGAYRDKDFCPGDIDDVDLAVFVDDYKRIKEIEESFIKFNFNKIHQWESKDGIAPEVAFEKNYGHIRSKIDIFFITPKDNKILWRFYKSDDPENNITKEISNKYFKRFDKIDFFDEKFNIPCDIENYLKDNYGENWKTPIHRDNWSWERDNQCKNI